MDMVWREMQVLKGLEDKIWETSDSAIKIMLKMWDQKVVAEKVDTV